MEAQVKFRDSLSGKYYFHSLHENVGAYIREPGPCLFGLNERQFFLVYGKGCWYITDDEEGFCFLFGEGGGYFKLSTKGQL